VQDPGNHIKHQNSYAVKGQPQDAGPAAAWAARAGDLTDWTLRLLVNRRDVWGGYGSSGQLTRPNREDRGRLLLTRDVLLRHYAAPRREHIAGLHTTSAQNLSRWLAIDIDCHGPGGNDPAANLAAALAWYGRLVALGLRPVLTSSNGAGGYHLRVIFRVPIATPRAHAFALWLVRDYARYGLAAAPETFPKQAAVSPPGQPGQYGNWLRVPGRHHKREHWSQVWDGTRWLDGAAAVAWLLNIEGDHPRLVPRAARPRPEKAPATCTSPGTRPVGDLSHRIEPYLRHLPHLGEGQGRDDVGFRFACWLARDLALPDDVTRGWLRLWNAGNNPPKSEAEITKWIANAHAYGRNQYGCGLGPQRTPRPGKPAITRVRRGHFILHCCVEGF
jgi:hypothetical protein